MDGYMKVNKGDQYSPYIRTGVPPMEKSREPLPTHAEPRSDQWMDQWKEQWDKKTSNAERSPVEIVRSRRRIKHLKAQTERDAKYSLRYEKVLSMADDLSASAPMMQMQKQHPLDSPSLLSKSTDQLQPISATLQPLKNLPPVFVDRFPLLSHVLCQNTHSGQRLSLEELLRMVEERMRQQAGDIATQQQELDTKLNAIDIQHDAALGLEHTNVPVKAHVEWATLHWDLHKTEKKLADRVINARVELDEQLQEIREQNAAATKLLMRVIKESQGGGVRGKKGKRKKNKKNKKGKKNQLEGQEGAGAGDEGEGREMLSLERILLLLASSRTVEEAPLQAQAEDAQTALLTMRGVQRRMEAALYYTMRTTLGNKTMIQSLSITAFRDGFPGESVDGGGIRSRKKVMFMINLARMTRVADVEKRQRQMIQDTDDIEGQNKLVEMLLDDGLFDENNNLNKSEGEEGEGGGGGE
jgi:hypothetical protein